MRPIKRPPFPPTACVVAAAVSVLFCAGTAVAQGQEKSDAKWIVKINTPTLVCYSSPDPRAPDKKLSRHPKESIALPLAILSKPDKRGYFQVKRPPKADHDCWVRAGQVETDLAKNVKSSCLPVKISQAAHAGIRGVGESCN